MYSVTTFYLICFTLNTVLFAINYIMTLLIEVTTLTFIYFKKVGLHVGRVVLEQLARRFGVCIVGNALLLVDLNHLNIFELLRPLKLVSNFLFAHATEPQDEQTQLLILSLQQLNHSGFDSVLALLTVNNCDILIL